MALVKSHHVWKDAKSPNHFLYMGKNVWAINTQKKRMEMFKWDHEDGKWRQIDMIWKRMPEFDNLDNLDSKCVFCVSADKIYMWRNNDEQKVFMFDTKTLWWTKVIRLENYEREYYVFDGIFVYNNKLYSLYRGKILTVCLTTGIVKFVDYPNEDRWIWQHKFVEVNGSMYCVSIDQADRTSLRWYNDATEQFDNILTIPTPTPETLYPNRDVNPCLNVWSYNNVIYTATEFIYLQTLLIHYFDFESNQWVKLGQFALLRDDMTQWTIFGEDQEFHMFKMNNEGVRHELMQFKPKLEDLALRKLAEQTAPNEKEMVANKLPIPLQGPFTQAFDWREIGLQVTVHYVPENYGYWNVFRHN